MSKVRNTTPEEETEFDVDEIQEAVESGEIREGDPEQLAKALSDPNMNIVISDQVREFLAEEGLSVDEMIAGMIKSGKRIQ